MATETLGSLSVKIRLENGRDAAGNMRYKSNALQYVSRDGYDADKFYAVASALSAAISKNFAGGEAVKTYIVNNS